MYRLYNLHANETSTRMTSGRTKHTRRQQRTSKEHLLTKNKKIDILHSVDYWNMFLFAILTDAELQVGKKNFKVHRAIISSRSPVFTELFNTCAVGLYITSELFE
jgi:hypothetical protein